MQTVVANMVEALFNKDNTAAYKALKVLEEISDDADLVYPFMDEFGAMLDSDNSYIRTRGITLIAYNAKWDKENKIEEIIYKYLKHIADKSPITARQCIKCLPTIAKYKPELRNDILRAFEKADASDYAQSMSDLVRKDIRKAIHEVRLFGDAFKI